MPAQVTRELRGMRATIAAAFQEHVGAPRGAIRSILAALIATAVATALLLALNSYLEAEHLIVGYLFPTAIIAMHYGGSAAVLTSFLSGLAGSYFLFPPKFSFFISDPRHVVELSFFLVLAITAGRALAIATDRDRAADGSR